MWVWSDSACHARLVISSQQQGCIFTARAQWQLNPSNDPQQQTEGGHQMTVIHERSRVAITDGAYIR